LGCCNEYLLGRCNGSLLEHLELGSLLQGKPSMIGIIGGDRCLEFFEESSEMIFDRLSSYASS
jgi:hypothetical protein